MILFAKAMGQLSSNSYERAFIGKITYQRLVLDINDEDGYSEPQFKVFKEKGNAFIEIIRIQRMSGEKVLENMQVIIVLAQNYNNTKQEKVMISSAEKPFRSFGKEEVYEFSSKVKDTNSIHLTHKPVVQGMFLFGELMKYIRYPDNATIKYSNPILAGNMIYLKEGKDILKGFSNEVLCFEMKYKYYKGREPL